MYIWKEYTIYSSLMKKHSHSIRLTFKKENKQKSLSIALILVFNTNQYGKMLIVFVIKIN